MRTGRGDAVLVEAAARLHFGMLDLRGALGRRFGGMGVAVPALRTVVEVEESPDWRMEGPDATRAAEYARRLLALYGVRAALHVRVHAAIPAHRGLGSGTQLALAAARGAAELFDLPSDPAALARAVGRAARSGVGTWLFARGGFVLEGGRRPGVDAVAPLLARLPVPAAWRCVLALPPAGSDMTGERERAAFARLEPPPQSEVEHVAHLTLMGVLPALVESDLAAFGSALSEIQRVVGGWFAPAQGGIFATREGAALVERLAEWGAAGVGQSSWGPAIYALVEGDDAAMALAARARALVPDGAVYTSAFADAGAVVTRRAAPAERVARLSG